MKIKKLPNKSSRQNEGLVEKNIAKNIKTARISVGLSQKELGEMLGFKSATALSLIEEGKRKISTGKLWMIADITGNRIDSMCLNQPMN